MRTFRCDNCNQLIFFENVRCLRCQRALGYLSDVADMSSLEQVAEDLWLARAPAVAGRRYRMCANYARESVCNWMVPVEDAQALCLSCRLTETIPNLQQWGNRERWYKLESAKRRLLYTLLALELPMVDKATDPQRGLAFAFLSDLVASSEIQCGKTVLTGHRDGLITVNLAEADDPIREQTRERMGEAYRTVLGHLRHESGHYYWDRLVADSGHHEQFRSLFGDEREDYASALRHYYQDRAPLGWEQHFVSAYASSHPWEDWAETWAHYLHLVDTLDTAQDFSVTLRPPLPGNRSLAPSPPEVGGNFATTMAEWTALTFALNNLNRSMGLPDPYPFALSALAIEKLRFVHEVICSQRRQQLTAAATPPHLTTLRMRLS